VNLLKTHGGEEKRLDTPSGIPPEPSAAAPYYDRQVGSACPTKLGDGRDLERPTHARESSLSIGRRRDTGEGPKRRLHRPKPRHLSTSLDSLGSC